MNLRTWIGASFQEHHIFEHGPPECCEEVYPRFAKFCMVCGEAVAAAPDRGFRPEWEPLSGLLAPIIPSGDQYPRECVWLDKHISAQWVSAGSAHRLVVGLSLGSSQQPYGHRGPDQILSTTMDDDRFKWQFKTVDRFFKQMGLNRKGALIIWASVAVEEAVEEAP